MSDEKKSFEESVNELDTGPDYKKVKGIAQNEGWHKVGLAKQMLEELKDRESESGLVNFDFPVSFVPDGERDLDQQMLLEIYENFLRELEREEVVQDASLTEQSDVDPDSDIPADIVHIKFKSDTRRLKRHLEEHIKKGPDGLVIYVEPGYGFYVKGRRERVYPLTSKHKRFQVIVALMEGKRFTAEDFVNNAYISRTTKASDECKDINRMFKKKCGVSGDVICYSKSEKAYYLNERYVIREANPS